MALIGSIANWGEVQGQINDANGVLTGVISSAELLGGEIVGMRGLKGDKGDTGDTGATGADGQDGFSPSASVTKVGDTATITITDKDGTTTAEVQDGHDGNVFIVELGETTYQEVVDAADDGAIVLLHVENISIGEKQYYPLVQIYNHRCVFVCQRGAEIYFYLLNDNNSWDSQTYTFITTETDPTVPSWAKQATKPTYTASEVGAQETLVSGTNIKTINNTSLLGSGDISVGGDTNVQSDWEQSDNTADDYIKNKPSIHNVPSGGTSGQVLSKGSNDDYDLAWTTVSSGGGGEIAYCTCTDSASTVAKTATLVNGSFDSLTTGAQVAVKFTYTNTATNPTLNVNNTGAKGIRRGGTTYVGTNTNESWGAGNVVILVYDGTDWQVANWLNTTYTGGTGAQIITGTEALNKVWSPQQIHDGILGLADKNVQSDWNEADSTDDAYIKNKPKIAFGYESVGSINASSYKDVEITHNLGSNTRVVASMYSSGTAINIGDTSVAVHDVDSTTAKIRVFNNRSATLSPGVTWIAVNS